MVPDTPSGEGAHRAATQVPPRCIYDGFLTMVMILSNRPARKPRPAVHLLFAAPGRAGPLGEWGTNISATISYAYGDWHAPRDGYDELLVGPALDEDDSRRATQSPVSAQRPARMASQSSILVL